MPRYFTPSSLARKGRTEFVKDRCRRLGLPMLFYFYILGPLADFICRFTQKKAFSYTCRTPGLPGSSFGC